MACMLPAMFLAAIILSFVGDGLRFRQMQSALCATHHVFRRAFRLGRRGKVLEEPPHHVKCQPSRDGNDDKPDQIHSRCVWSG